MASKARYWKNPDLHRAYNRKKYAKMKALGLRQRDLLSPQAVKNWSRARHNWNLAHKASCLAAGAKFRKKLVRLFGNCGYTGCWRHYMMKEEQRNVARKKATTAILQRKLVEGHWTTFVVRKKPRT